MFNRSNSSHERFHTEGMVCINELRYASLQRGVAAGSSFTSKRMFSFHSRPRTSHTVCSPVSRVFSHAHHTGTLAHTSARSLGLSNLPLPLPELIATSKISISSQPSYNLQPPAPPTPTNNNPTQGILKTNHQTMASNTLTDNDRKVLAAAWHCFETQPKARKTFPTSKPKQVPPQTKPRTNPALTSHLPGQLHQTRRNDGLQDRRFRLGLLQLHQKEAALLGRC